MRRKKYFEGGRIYSLDEIAKEEFIFFNSKLYHCGWFGSWHFRLIKTWAKDGRIYRAIRNV